MINCVTLTFPLEVNLLKIILHCSNVFAVELQFSGGRPLTLQESITMIEGLVLKVYNKFVLLCCVYRCEVHEKLNKLILNSPKVANVVLKNQPGPLFVFEIMNFLTRK